MKLTPVTIAGLCAGLTAFAAPTLAGPEHKDHAHEDKMSENAEPTLEDLVGEVQTPKLFIGSEAPKLQIAKFVKGDSVQQFEDGKAYVVEFWATWCGPCIAAFPHLSELQNEYGDKVQIIGVNIWEGVEDQTERIEKIENFVEEQGERMQYSVAVEEGSAMADTWMRPADQNGIPAAFIVDKTGHIAWIGHPMAIDETLKKIVSGEFDRQAAVEEYKNNALLMKAANQFAQQMQSGQNLDQATTIAKIVVSDYISEDPQMLNAVAWMLLNADGVSEKQHKLAAKAAGMAAEITGWNDWSVLDTYALAQHKLGNTEEAIKWEKKAIQLVPEENLEAKAELQQRLQEFESQG